MLLPRSKIARNSKEESRIAALNWKSPLVSLWNRSEWPRHFYRSDFSLFFEIEKKKRKNFDTVVAVPVLEAIKCFFLDFFRKGGNRKETFSVPPLLRLEPFPLPVLYLLRMFPPGKERKYSRKGDDESKVRRRWPHWLFIFLHRLGSEIPFLEPFPFLPSPTRPECIYFPSLRRRRRGRKWRG